MTVRNNKIGLRARKTAAFIFLLMVSINPILAQNTDAKFAAFAANFRRECQGSGIVGGSFLFLIFHKLICAANKAANLMPCLSDKQKHSF